MLLRRCWAPVTDATGNLILGAGDDAIVVVRVRHCSALTGLKERLSAGATALPRVAKRVVASIARTHFWTLLLVPEERDITPGVEDVLARAYNRDRISLHVSHVVGAPTTDETRLNQTSPIDRPYIRIAPNSDAAGPASGVYAHGLASEGLILHAIDIARRI